MKQKQTLRNIRNILFSFVSILLFAGCTSFYKQTEEIENFRWEANQVLTFEIPIKEPNTEKHAWSIYIQHIAQFLYAKIPLTITIESPSKQKTTINFTLNIKNKDGQPNGSVIGDIVDLETTAPNSLIFNEKGTYQISITATLEPPVSMIGILAVGVVIK